MISQKITCVPCGESGEGKFVGIIETVLGYTIAAILIGSVFAVILMISYIIPGVNVLAKLLIRLRNGLGFGFWKGILFFIGVCGGFGLLIGLRSSYRTFSKRILDKRLSAANFRRVEKECDLGAVCHGCEYQDVILLDKSDPDNSKRELFCKYFPFKFKGAECGLDLVDITCDHYETERLFQELVDIVKSQSSEYK